jgi:hypothetical protein
VIASAKADIKPGNAMPFSGMPIGTIVHNIEMKPGKGGQIARAAGTYAQFVGRDGGYAQIRLSRASCAWCARNAWPPSARCRTPTTRTRTSARPAATATWASVRASAVSR